MTERIESNFAEQDWPTVEREYQSTLPGFQKQVACFIASCASASPKHGERPFRGARLLNESNDGYSIKGDGWSDYLVSLVVYENMNRLYMRAWPMRTDSELFPEEQPRIIEFFSQLIEYLDRWLHPISPSVESGLVSANAAPQPPAGGQSNGETNGKPIKPKGKRGRKSQWSVEDRDKFVENWRNKGPDDPRTLPVFLCDEVGEKDELDSIKPKPVISESQFYKWCADYDVRHPK